MERISMNERKKMYLDCTYLISIMENFECDQSEKNKLKLDFSVMTSEKIMLPSGKWGTVLSLALETHHFITANYIIENREKLFVSLDYVACELDKVGAAIHFEDELDFALSYYNDEEDEMIKYSNAMILEKDESKNIYEENKKAIEKLLNFKRFKRC